MADYVTADELGAFSHELTNNTTTTDLLVTSASRLFDNLCEVSEDFFAVTSGSFTNRVFYGDGTAYLKLDPFTALNSVNPVVIDPDTDVNYDLPDYTAIDNFLVVLDETKMQSDIAASYPNRFTGWHQGVKVTVSAKWGFTAVPADVKMAVIALAIHQWRTADPAFATISNAEGAAARPITIPQIAEAVIDKYREKYSKKFVFA